MCSARQFGYVQVETQTASPFAASLLFNYTANFLYEGDTPLAERRAQTLALDHAQLRELLGDAELRELLCGDAVDQVCSSCSGWTNDFGHGTKMTVHDLLRHLGDLTRGRNGCPDRATRSARRASWSAGCRHWWHDRRVIRIRVAGRARYAAAEDASRFRDALGIVPPPGLPDAFLQQVDDPLGDLVSRYAQDSWAVSSRKTSLNDSDWESLPSAPTLEKLVASGRILEGEFLPGGRGREWCDAHVLRLLKRRSSVAAQKSRSSRSSRRCWRASCPQWQGITQPRRGLDGLLDVIQQLQGLAAACFGLGAGNPALPGRRLSSDRPG